MKHKYRALYVPLLGALAIIIGATAALNTISSAVHERPNPYYAQLAAKIKAAKTTDVGDNNGLIYSEDNSR